MLGDEFCDTLFTPAFLSRQKHVSIFFTATAKLITFN